MPLVRNPVLPGFHPDPSILRVGDVYYLATSTFQWFPGVLIYQSKDLANWELAARPLNRKSLLDMRGHPDGAGIWAPCLSHDGERFWLVFTDVRRKEGSFKDTLNYITTATDITGPWSESSYINASGFDPSLFHDDDGRKWFINMLWDHRRRKNPFAGIVVQELNPATCKLVGPKKNVFYGTEIGYTEGPHLYKRNGWYYLLTAEGGTQYYHTCTLARSRSLWGPYEVHPQTFIMTSKDDPLAALQRAGHGDIVDTPDGKIYVAHLMSRPITQRRRCVLGRETSFQEAYWGEDDWLYIKGGPVPALDVELPGQRDESAYWAKTVYDFESGLELHSDFQWLRTPDPNRIFSIGTGGGLKLIGREAIGSWYEQALVARRQTHFSYRAETVLSFSPTDEREFAGLTAYYSRFNFFYLAVTATDYGQRELRIMSSQASFPHGDLDDPPVALPVPVPAEGKLRLALEIRLDKLQFFYALGGEEELEKIGHVLDASILSDECGGPGSFTGAFVGMACSDLNGTEKTATFDYLTYEPVHYKYDRY